VLVGLLAGTMFGLGFTMHKYRHFPYDQLSKMFRRELVRTRSPVDSSRVLSRQYSFDRRAAAIERDMNTALLPIKIRGIRLSDRYAVPKTAGSIAAVGEGIVILDRLGALHASSPSGDARRLDFPPLPNNIAAYVAAGHTIDSKRFRAYCVRYLSSSKTLVVSHETFDVAQQGTRMAVSLIDIDEKELRPIGPWHTIFKSDVAPDGPSNASGGALALDGRDKIYLTIGVYDTDLAQDAKSTFGKVVEISIATQKARILTIGHRNPQGLAMTSSGELWSTEHGPAGGDELNLIEAGANYGWPVVTLGTEYDTYSWMDGRHVGRHTGYRLPIFAWVPTIAVSNLVQIENFNERWNGDLLVASLKAQSLFRLRLDGKRVVYSEQIWMGQRIRDIARLDAGAIALWTDDAQLLFLSVDGERLRSNRRIAEPLNDTLARACMYCHHVGPTNVGNAAPSLSNLFQRRIGSDNYPYSVGLRSKQGVWTEDALRAFLSEPAKFANGTSMPQPDLSPQAIEEIIGALKSLSTQVGPDLATRH
jgi:cytochrome c2